MAENQEKTEAEILEETMQNLDLDDANSPSINKENEKNSKEIETQSIDDTIEDENSQEQLIEELLENDEDEITAIEDINLNNSKEEKVEEENSPHEESIKIEEDEGGIQKKQTKVHKILIIILGLLFTIVLTGVVLYFIGFFDPKPVVKEIKKESKVIKEDTKYKFDQKDINSKRLNSKLKLLTKYEIVENSDMEAKKAKEKENLYQEAKKQLEAERQAQIEKIKEVERKRLNEQLPPVDATTNIDNKIDQEIEQVIKKEDKKSNIQDVKTEERIKNQEKDDNIISSSEMTTKEIDKVNEKVDNKENLQSSETSAKTTENTPEDIIAVPPNNKVDNSEEIADINYYKPDTEKKVNVKTFIKVIKITTNKKDIFKSFLDKVLKIDSRVNLCRDDRNLVEIFIGPFEDEIERLNITQKYNDLELDAEAYDYTQEEYDKRCNY